MQNSLTPEYIHDKLSYILIALQEDIEKNSIKHKNELILMREVIEAKDKEIKGLQEQIQSYEKASREGNKNKDNHTTSFKRITLGKKPSKNISQFNSESLNLSTKMAESVLVDRKSDQNNQSAKSIKGQKSNLEVCSSIKSIKPLKSPRLPKPQVHNKENLMLSVKKSVEKLTKQETIISSYRASQAKQPHSGIKMKTSAKKKYSKEKLSLDQEKRCINIVIPTSSFCSYTIKSQI